MRITRRLATLLLTIALLALPVSGWAQTALGNPNTGSRGDVGAGRLLLGWGTADAESIRVDSTTLTNAQVLDLSDTPITLIAAPGAGHAIDVIGVLLSFDYTAAYTGGSNLRLFYGSRTAGSAASGVINTAGFLDATADTFVRVAGTPDNTTMASNTAVVIQAIAADHGGGNASNTVRVQTIYRVLAVP